MQCQGEQWTSARTPQGGGRMPLSDHWTLCKLLTGQRLYRVPACSGSEGWWKQQAVCTPGPVELVPRSSEERILTQVAGAQARFGKQGVAEGGLDWHVPSFPCFFQ